MAKSKADAARTEAARMTSLHERGLTSRNSMEASRVALTDAEAALTQAQALLDAIKAQEQQRTIVRARFAGIVAKVWHTKGEFVAVPGEPIVRVIDPNRTQVVIRVPLADYQRVLPGQAASVQPPGGSSLPATVVMRTAPTDLAATTAEVRLDLPGPTALPLDTPVQVEILIEERRDVLTVPAAAVQRETTPFVWIAGEDGRAHRRDVRVGLLSGGRAQILSGLTAGERVIVTGIGELNEGIAIRIS
jgi:RND family efflux transporter MFP subunit